MCCIGLRLELQSCDYYVTEESVLLQPILVFYSGATQNDFTLTFRAVNISSAADLLTSPDSTDPAFIATPGKCQMMEQKLYHVCVSRES